MNASQKAEQKAEGKVAYIGKTGFTPLGEVWVALSEDGLIAVDLENDQKALEKRVRSLGFTTLSFDPRRTAEATRQISEYLQGQRKSFDLPIDWSVLRGFQRQVLELTQQIPYGTVSTYGELARRLGRPGAARAVGRAQATNPMPLVIPCHRVIGSDGGLHGYGAPGGLKTKAWLLDLEKRP